MRTVLLAAVSADGKIADSKGDQSMLTSKADRRHLRSYMESADLLILGRRTFEKHRVALLNYHCAVITSSVDGTVHVSKNQTLWNPTGRSFAELLRDTRPSLVCILGGAAVYTLARLRGWIDELVLTSVPQVTLQDGVPLFTDCSGPELWALLDSGALGFSPARSDPIEQHSPEDSVLHLRRFIRHDDAALPLKGLE